eukprot:12894392-Prorocentrum_lima.AAC.1
MSVAPMLWSGVSAAVNCVCLPRVLPITCPAVLVGVLVAVGFGLKSHVACNERGCGSFTSHFHNTAYCSRCSSRFLVQ